MSALHSQTETPYQDHKEGTDTENTENGSLLQQGSVERLPSLPEVPLQNFFTSLGTSEEGPIMSGEMQVLS